MQVILKKGSNEKEIEQVSRLLASNGSNSTIVIRGVKTIIETIEDITKTGEIEELSSVEKILPETARYPLAAKAHKQPQTIIEVNGKKIGGPETVIIAGPCAVESESQVDRAAQIVSEAGMKILRGGAFKPRTSPYSFQGLGMDGLKIMKTAADKYGLAVITEIARPDNVEIMYPYLDIFQVGARNMQNFDLLKELGKTDKPVMIKRSISATLDELLFAAEYVLQGGNENVILCERGIRSFDRHTRFMLDISAIPVLKDLTHLPVFADPSHAAGLRRYVPPLAKAALAAGADGLMLEVHADPDSALSDGPQALTPQGFKKLMEELYSIK